MLTVRLYVPCLCAVDRSSSSPGRRPSRRPKERRKRGGEDALLWYQFQPLLGKDDVSVFKVVVAVFYRQLPDAEKPERYSG